MAAVSEHYENHLAKYYAWILGGATAKTAENRKFFKDHDIHPIRSALAFDLGAGCGFQSIPLAELGFKVVAIDLSAKLLTQLKKTAPRLPIETVCDDLLNFTDYDRGDIELVVCMGDTLTHLETLKKVQGLLDKVYSTLQSGGRLVMAFRDLTQELRGLDRFIPVRSDPQRIFTCFLEYEKETVKVHDIIYEQTNDQWQLKKSFFRKLRIPPDWTCAYLQKIGFRIAFDQQLDGMVTIIAQKD